MIKIMRIRRGSQEDDEEEIENFLKYVFIFSRLFTCINTGSKPQCRQRFFLFKISLVLHVVIGDCRKLKFLMGSVCPPIIITNKRKFITRRGTVIHREIVGLKNQMFYLHKEFIFENKMQNFSNKIYFIFLTDQKLFVLFFSRSTNIPGGEA